eukprot:m.223563 g.223563  ORF g.223563 m.223563 type:complete len:495 (+) comp18755_c0_seq8:113-1597(+)
MSRRVREAEAEALLDDQEVSPPDTNDTVISHHSTHNDNSNADDEPDEEWEQVSPPTTLEQWKRYVALAWFCFASLGITLVVPYCAWILWTESEQTHAVAWLCATVFVGAAVPISIYEVSEHLAHWHQPELQILVVRILWMVPIYALDSLLALRFNYMAVYLDSAREVYESYVIYNFMAFLCTYVKQSTSLERRSLECELVAHPTPLCWLKPWRIGGDFFSKCTDGVNSYVVVQLWCASVALVGNLTNSYEEGDLSFGSLYMYLALATSTAQTWAMYCLILFYTTFHKELAPMNPVAKLLAIKAIVFFSFWQGVAISLLVHWGLIDEVAVVRGHSFRVATGLQDFLVCIEMLFAAIAHHYIFSYRDFPRPSSTQRRQLTLAESLHEMLSMTDVHEGLTRTVTNHAHRVVSTVQLVTPTALFPGVRGGGNAAGDDVESGRDGGVAGKTRRGSSDSSEVPSPFSVLEAGGGGSSNDDAPIEPDEIAIDWVVTSTPEV